METTAVVFRAGAIEEIETLLNQHLARRLMLVIDRQAFVLSGAEAKLCKSLGGREVHVFDHFTPNPRLFDVEMGLAAYRAVQPHACIAIGGGSAIDVAKAIHGFAHAEISLREFLTQERVIDRNPDPLIVVPTTAGTGSEATHFAVVYDQSQKLSLAHAALLPDHVLLDPELTYPLPKSVSLASGLDALCQSLESLWAVGSNDQSIQHAKSAAQLAKQALEQVVLQPDSQSRADMMWSAHLAGRAINISKTTGPHAMSYRLTSHHGCPHGEAVALMFPAFLSRFESLDASNCHDSRGESFVRSQVMEVVNLLGATTIQEACEAWRAMLERLGAPSRLRDLALSINDLTLLVNQVNSQRLANHPQQFESNELLEMMQTIY